MPRCPKCKIQAEPIRYEGVRVYNCGECGGHWLDGAKLDLILARREVVMPGPVKQKMIEIADASNSTEKLWCMTCGKEMIKDQFKHWAEIQIDFCPKCKGIWLDRGELEKCQICWEYMQDNPDTWENMETAERTALLDAELAARKAHNRQKRETAKDILNIHHGGLPGPVIGDLFL